MTTGKTRSHCVSFNRILIMVLALVGIWYRVDIPEDIVFSLATAFWLYLPKLTHFELNIIDKWWKK